MSTDDLSTVDKIGQALQEHKDRYGLSDREMAALLVSCAFSVLKDAEPDNAVDLLLYAAARVTGTAVRVDQAPVN